jgi:Domain of unknown function (DUF4388)
MSQTPRFTRARQLTASVLPGRRADGYPSAVSARLQKIAAARSTGMLPFSGRCDGAIYFRDGKVVYAASGRTPGPATLAEAALAGLSPLGQLTARLAVAEPSVDAALELLSSESRCAKFRADRLPHSDLAPSIGVDDLLAEVARRQRFLKQLSAVLTSDTAVARNPHIRSEAVRVSALQWALLIRVRHGSTPRDLAWELTRSVFGTTAEVYRLLALRLLYVAGNPARARGPVPGDAPDQDLPVMSFVRAVSPQKGDQMPLTAIGPALGAVD